MRRSADSDGDGLSDTEGAELGTDPNWTHADDDGFTDEEEVNVWGTNSMDADDHRGRTDGEA